MMSASAEFSLHLKDETDGCEFKPSINRERQWMKGWTNGEFSDFGRENQNMVTEN